MKTYRDFQPPFPPQASVLTIGNFDGVHLGHQAIIRRVVHRASELGAVPTLVTFDPHPLEVVRPESKPAYLTSLEEKLEYVARLGVEAAHVITFTPQFRKQAPAEFVELLATRVQPLEIWVGPDFRFGHDRSGDAAYLAQVGERHRFRVEVLEPLHDEGGIISSSRIRHLVVSGDVEEAGRLLGRAPTVEGVVEPGARRGAGLGYPTANLEVDGRRVLPKDGIYAVHARLPALERCPGVASLGVRPTFEAYGQRLLEVHLFDFSQPLYGLPLRVSFVHYLRPEVRFANAKALSEQMRQDEAQARAVLSAMAARE